MSSARKPVPKPRRVLPARSSPTRSPQSNIPATARVLRSGSPSSSTQSPPKASASTGNTPAIAATGRYQAPTSVTIKPATTDTVTITNNRAKSSPNKPAIRSSSTSEVEIVSVTTKSLPSASESRSTQRTDNTSASNEPKNLNKVSMDSEIEVVPAGTKRAAPLESDPWEIASSDAESDCNSAERIRLLTWNIDMDSPYRSLRTRALIAEIRQSRADIVLLQEVTDNDEDGGSVLATLQRALCTPPTAEEEDEDVLSYNLTLPHCADDYFCILLARRGLFKPASIEARAEAFPNSNMGRGLITLRATLASGACIQVHTAHLESLKIGARQRKDQLTQIISHLRAAAANGCTAFFAGDTNLRETEVPAADVAKTIIEEAKRDQPLPTNHTQAAARKKAKIQAKIADAWVLAGAPTEHKFTWDTARNDMREMENMQFSIRTRYDRVFTLASPASFPDVVSFRLLGTNRLESTSKFISDHFGIVVDFDVYK